MKKNIFFIITLLSFALNTNAQTFTANPNASITNNGQHCYSINVTGVGTIDCGHGLEQVCIDIDHTYDADLDIYLVAPDGTQVELTTDNGGSGNDYSNTCFDMSASTNITSGSAPFSSGPYVPEGDLATVNNGQNANGTWQICITDDANGDDGTFYSWSLTFGNNAACNDIVINSGNNGNSYTTCNNHIYDDGGPTGDYSNNQDYYVTVCSGSTASCPSNPMLTFNTFDLENNADYLYIYDGNSTSAPQVPGSPFTGNTLPPNITATGTCLTIRFVSDNDWMPTGDDGFDISVSCTGNAPASNYCDNATPVCNLDGYCGNTSSTYNAAVSVSDPTDEDNTPLGSVFCGSIENNSWIQFTASATTATLNVEVSNCANNYGIQMQVYSTNDCYNYTAVSNCESPGTATDITVNATGLTVGQVYYLMIDGYAGDVCDYVINPSGGVMTADAIITETNNDTATVCSGGTVHFSASGGTTYSWTPTTGLSNPNIANPTATVTSTTTYTVAVSGGNPLCPTTATASVTVIVANGLTTSISGSDPACNGGNGTAVITVTGGGTPNYTYDWSNGTSAGPTSSASNTQNLPDGSYTVTVTDAGGCTSTETITLNEPTAISITGTATAESCNGANDGSIDITVSGGTSGYTYHWSTGATTQDISGLADGNYTVTVQDVNNCQQTATFTVNPGPTVSVSSTAPANQCLTGNNFSFSATGSPSGGTYSWDFGDGNTGTGSSASHSYASSGTYTVVVTYNYGSCSDQVQYDITVYPQPNATAVVDNNVSCNGLSDGQATASGGGTYSWSSGGTSATETGLSAGTYTVTVTSSVGSCTSTASVTITEPNALVANVAVNDVTCNGGNDGSAQANITTTSTSPYDYQWSSGGSTLNTTNLSDTETGLSAGSYTVTITDDNGCTQTLNFTVNEPPAFSVTQSHTDATCGQANGDASVSASGATPPYTYLWSNGNTTNSISGVTSGTYTVTITDAATPGCTHIETINIADAGGPSVSITSSTDPLCNGGSDGTATATITTTSASPYDYSWSNGSSTNNTTSLTDNVSGLSSGTISVVVTDNNGCTASASVTLNDPPAIVLSNTVVDEICGQTNGSIDLSVSGGTGTYSYTWSPAPSVSGQEDQNNLSAGTYNVTVQDANNCQTTDAITVNGAPGLIVAINTSTNPLCNGDCNGSAVVTITTTSTSPYSYSWSNGNSTASTTSLTDTATALCANTAYDVIVTDANGCNDTATVTLTDPAQLTTSVNGTDVLCYNGNDGTATVTANGGTSPYTYLWSTAPAQTTATATNLQATTYYVTVTDANGCTKVDSVLINQPTQLLVSTSSNPETCGVNNGDVTATASGGTSGYNYSWGTTPVQNTATATGLSTGTYIVTVTDANGCTQTANVFVDSVAGGSATISPYNDVSCNGANDGSATVSMGGGTSPFTYSWNSGQNTQTISGVGPGTYIVTVTDNIGCTAIDTVTITEPTALTLNIPNDYLACNGNTNGSLTATVGGGTSPYTYQWNDPMLSTLDSCYNLPAGTYAVTVQDANGCTIIDSGDVIEPLPITITDSSIDAQCGQPNGSIDITVTGGTTPYSYSWTDGNSYSSTNEDISNLPAATYTVVVTDNKGCTESISVVINDLGSPTAVIDTSGDVSCYGAADGLATVLATGGTGVGTYTYSWSTTPVQNTATATNLSGGTYNVLVTDTNGCTANASVTINEPAYLTYNLFTVDNPCNGDSLGQASVVPIGGTSPYTYQWIGGGNNPNDSLNTGMQAGTYNLIITDANGCDTINNNIVITEPPFISLTVSHTDVSCNSLTDGTATVTATGGTVTNDYLYIWDSNAGNQTTQTATGLGAGTYWVTVQDDNGCEESISVTINEPTPLLFNNMSSTDLTCYMSSDGTINSGATGGTPGYTFNWTNDIPPYTWSSTQQNLTSLEAGTYSLTVTDGNGCTIDTSIILTQPFQLTISLTVTDESCANLCDGSITTTVNGGTPPGGPYNYTWNQNGVFFSSSQNLTNLCVGQYDVTVTDNNGCTITSNETITGPNPLLITINSVNDATCGSTNGAIDISFSGGTGVPSVLWSSGQTTEDITGISAGNYCVSVTDANACETDTCIGVSNIGGPIINGFTVNDVTCNGNSNGWISADTSHPSSPALPYTIVWDDGTNTIGAGNGGGTDSIYGLPGGNYTITITDNNGCFSIGNASINEPSQVTVNTGNIQDLTCNGVCTGYASAAGGGGVGGYSYSWSNGDLTATASNLCAGIHSVTVTDGNGCQAVGTATVQEPAPLVINLDYITDALCNGTTDGAISVSPSGGSGSYAYNWLGQGVNTSVIGNIGQGTYTVVVSDQNDLTCSTDSSFTVNEPLPITATTTTESTTCGNPNGSATIVGVSGGTSPYNYVWSPCSGNCNGATLNNLTSGTYQVQVFDSHGCSEVFSANVGDIPPPYVNNTDVKDVSCNGGNDGVATVMINDGTSPYSYNWSPYGGPDSTSSNLMAGTYTVTVTDANGCETYTSFSIGEPTPVIVYGDGPTTPICIGMLANISANAAGGTAPYTYSWNSGLDSTQIHQVYPTTTTTYLVGAVDANGCTSAQTSITVEVYPPITVNSSPDANICEADTQDITASATGGNGGPYTYIWNIGSGNPNYVSPTQTTTYTVYANDACGSPSDTAQTTVFVRPAPYLITDLQGYSGCEPLSVSYSPEVDSVGGNVSYLWNFGDIGSSNNTSNLDSVSHEYLTSGNYSVMLTLTSDYQCSKNYVYNNLVRVYPNPNGEFFVTPEVVGLFDPEVNFYDLTTDPIASWYWNFGDNSTATIQNPTHKYDAAGEYEIELIVRTINGCVDTVYHTVQVNEEHTFYAPTAFTPGAGIGNKYFYPKGVGIDKGQYQLTVYDRWGQIIYQSNKCPLGTDKLESVEGGWNGRYNNTGEYVEEGTYLWKVNLVDVNGVPHEYKGTVVIMR